MRAWLLISCCTLVGISSCTDTDSVTAGGGGTAGANAAPSGEAGEAGTPSSAPAGGSSSARGMGNEAGNGGNEAGNGGMGNEAGDGGMGASVELPGIGGTSQADGAAGAAGSEADPPSAPPPEPAGGDLSDVRFSPLTLTPSFSTTVHDYYVRCEAGANALTLTTTDNNGAKSSALTLYPDQAVVVGESYWVRCLPPDFPIVTVTQPGTPTPGYYLLNSLSYGAVFDVRGVPVWYARGAMPIGLDSPAVNTLSFMRDALQAAPKTPSWEIRDLNTGLVTTVASPTTPTDDHELRVLTNGDYLVFTYPVETDVDLTGVNSYGPDESIYDCEIQELNPSGSLVWSWLASDHIDPKYESLFASDGLVNGVSVADVFHCNGIDVDGAGNLLVSMRHTNSAFYVERTTGKILWKLGGSAYNKDGAALIRVQNDSQGGFSLQHDVRFQPNGNVTLFDDHGMGTGYARGIEFAIDHDANTATPVFQYLGSGASLFEGSFRRYADGDSVIGWGYIPGDLRVMTEIDSSGQNVFDITFSGAGNQTYRAIKVPLSQLDINLLRQDTAR
ncbi:MAG: arylsulfotransferase family protein [Polyangiaceae bacterium]